MHLYTLGKIWKKKKQIFPSVWQQLFSIIIFFFLSFVSLSKRGWYASLFGSHVDVNTSLVVELLLNIHTMVYRSTYIPDP